MSNEVIASNYPRCTWGPDTRRRRSTRVISLIRTLAVFDSATFLIMSALHIGLRIPLGFAVMAEPRILPATIVEGTCGVLFAIASYAFFTKRTWRWEAAVTAHIVAMFGVLLGMAALAAGRGPITESNTIYHRVILVVILAGLFLLTRRFVRWGLKGRTPGQS